MLKEFDIIEGMYSVNLFPALILLLCRVHLLSPITIMSLLSSWKHIKTKAKQQPLPPITPALEHSTQFCSLDCGWMIPWLFLVEEKIVIICQENKMFRQYCNKARKGFYLYHFKETLNYKKIVHSSTDIVVELPSERLQK